MSNSSSSVVGMVERFAAKLRSSHLMAVLLALFLLDLVIPDPLPFLDEAVLGLLTLLAARWPSHRDPPPQPPVEGPIDVTGRGSDDGRSRS